MKRVDWTERLAETLEVHRVLPFRWGGRGDAHDCCTFVADCIEAMTGRAYLDGLLKNYHDEASAYVYIKGAGGLVAAISQHLGPSKPAGPIRTGDVVVWSRKGIECAGIALNRQIVAAQECRFGLISVGRAVAAWSV